MIVKRPVDRHLLSDAVAREIEQMILSDSIKSGQKLPSETRLSEMFGVSRTILREALKTLRERGLVRIEVGQGVYAMRPEEVHFRDTLLRLMRFSETTLESIYEFRIMVEVPGCNLATDRISDDEIELLEDNVAEMKTCFEDHERWVELEVEFHSTIANSVRNPLYGSLMGAITTRLSEVFQAGLDKAKPEGIRGHTEIVAALRSRDSRAAEEAMRNHLSASRRLVVGE